MRYVVALHCPIYQVGEGTAFQSLLIEYIENFFDKSDVLEDIREYLTLLKKTDAVALCSRIEFRVNQTEEFELDEIKIKGGNPDLHTLPLKLLRFKMIYHKLARVLGIFSDVEDKFKHAMEIYTIFLQAMENHPSVLSTVGVALIHSTQYNTSLGASRSTLSNLDLVNAEEVLLVAVLELEEIKVYDSAVLQPYNFVMVAMLEHALQYYPDSMRI